MPDQIVAVDLDAVRCGIVDVTICVCEGEVAARWLGDLPLLSILWGDATILSVCSWRFYLIAALLTS